MLRRVRAMISILAICLAIALPLGACSKCDAAGWFKSCGDAAPRAIAAAQ